MLEIRRLSPARFGDPLLEVRIKRGVSSYPATFKWLLAGFAALCLCVSGTFALLGATPVLGFCGLELMLLFFFLRRSFRRAGVAEDVSIAGDATVVHRDGAEAARLQSYWLSIEPSVWGGQGLILSSRGQNIAVGSGLGARELNDLAAALRDGLHRLKSSTPAI